MSNEVTNLCRPLWLEPPSRKSVLMCLADRADDNGRTWPASAAIVEWTCLGRSTVLEVLQTLEEAGLILAEARPLGRPTVYLIQLEKIAAEVANPSSARTGRGPAAGRVKTPAAQPDPSKSRTGDDPFPIAADDTTRPAAGRVEAADPSSPRTGVEHPPVQNLDPHPSSIRTGVVQPLDGGGPAAGPLTPITSINTSKTPKKSARTRTPGFDALTVELPDWLPDETWAMWVRNRLATRKPISEDAARLQLSSLAKLRAAGEDPVLVIENAIAKGWQGLYPARDGSTKAGSAGKSQPTTRGRNSGFDQLDYEEGVNADGSLA